MNLFLYQTSVSDKQIIFNQNMPSDSYLYTRCLKYRYIKQKQRSFSYKLFNILIEMMTPTLPATDVTLLMNFTAESCASMYQDYAPAGNLSFSTYSYVITCLQFGINVSIK